MNYNHGGDIYGNKVILDFSVNINPLGMPDSAKEAALRGVELSTGYPDWEQRELRNVLSKYLDVPGEDILFGNGASDLIYRLMMVLKPKEVLVPAPSFSEYRSAAEKAGAKVLDFILKEEDSFRFTDDAVAAFIDRIEHLAAGSAVFLCNPNNPDGSMIPKRMLLRIYEVCEKKSIWLIVDECFLPFSSREEEYSLIPNIRKRANELTDSSFDDHENENRDDDHLIVLRAFTKIYGMPGLRLGYLVTENPDLIRKIREAMSPWEINTPAQMAGVAALSDGDYLKETRRMIKEERKYLIDEILRNGLAERIYNPDSEANFILFKVSCNSKDLKYKLKEKGILIRDCSDFSGLDGRFFRICVRRHEENAELIETWKNIKNVACKGFNNINNML